jgi:trimeric autotransporter adhesin
MMVTILLAAGCAGQQPAEQNPGNNTTLAATFPVPSLPFTTIPVTVTTPPVPLQCPTGNNLTFTVAEGDSFLFSYRDNERYNTGVNMWVFGDHFANMTPLQSDAEGRVAYRLSEFQTHFLGSGCYDVILQYPPKEERTLRWPVINTSGYVMNDHGTTLFTIQDFQKSRIVEPKPVKIFKTEMARRGPGEMAEKVQLVIEKPWIRIDPVSDHVIGDKFTISGTTNLAVGDAIIVQVYSTNLTYLNRKSSIDPVPPEIRVLKGTPGNNTWTFYVNSEGFRNEPYRVSVMAEIQDAWASQPFLMSPSLEKQPGKERGVSVPTSVGIAP